MHANKRYPSIGRCIYCGCREGRRGDEHIVPRALAGDAIVFDDASCRPCETMINKFEQPVLRIMLGPARRAVGAPSRPRKGRKPVTHLPLRILALRPGLPSLVVRTLRVPANEYPMMFIGLQLTPPKILKGIAVDGTETVAATATIDKEALKRLDLVGLTVETGQITPYPFAQLLAKIAYSYAVAELGYGAFSSLVHPLLRSEADHFVDLVGGDYEIPAKEDERFSLQLFTFDTGVTKFQCVRVRLWGWLRTPVYHVVVGTL